MISALFQSRAKTHTFIPLDPLVLMFKLSLLHTYPISTKLSIHPCTINFQEPTAVQGSVRWFNGDNRDDITHLYSPLIWYLQYFYRADDERATNLVRLAIDGFEILKQVYRTTVDVHDTLLIHTIQHYIDLLSSPEAYLSKLRNENRAFHEAIIHKVRTTWTQGEIDFIYVYFNMVQAQHHVNGPIWKVYRRSFLEILREKENVLTNWWNYQANWTVTPSSHAPALSPLKELVNEDDDDEDDDQCV